MNDIESGYKVFVRTITGLICGLCFAFAATYTFSAAIAGGTVADTYGHRTLLNFWLLVILACYTLGSVVTGRFLWLTGDRPSIARLFLVVLIAATTLALISPLIQTVLREQQ